MDWELIAKAINSIIDNFFAKRTEHVQAISVQSINNIDLVVEKVCTNIPKYAEAIKDAVDNIDAMDKPVEVKNEDLPN